MSSPTNWSGHDNDHDETSDRARVGTYPHTRTPEASFAPSATSPFARPGIDYTAPPTYQSQQSYQSNRSANGGDASENTPGRTSLGGSTASTTPQSNSSWLSTSQTPPLQSPGWYREQEQGWGVSNLFTPFQRTSARYRNVDRNESSERPTLLRPNPNTDHINANHRSMETSRTSAGTSSTSSRRNSFGATVRYSENTGGHGSSRSPYGRMTSDIDLESIPGTPMPRPPKPWAYNSGRSSPVASSLYLPGQGIGSPGGASMQSMASSPHRSRQSLVHLFPDNASEIWDREWVKQGYIAKIHKRDDQDEWPNWKRYIYYTVPFLAIATLASYWVYFILRILFVLSAQRQQGKSFPMAWVFVAIEISVAVPTFMQMFWMVFILKARDRPKLRLVGNDVPTVDVFITCCGEDVDIVLDTARAACDVDYPQDRFRVVVLDDGNSTELMEAIENLNATYPNVAYRSRPKFPGVPHHFKAGNLNYGLDVVAEMPGGASRYIAALDADMIPEQHWLRAIMPHMLQDDKLAMACPPQLFYNVPAGDPLCQSLDFFVNVSEPIKDALGVAWCTGSGYVVRRDALEEIGCFPQGSLAEDVATSTLLLGRGWKCAFIHEPLQFGTVPEDFGGHLKQRTRWAIGTVDTSIKLKFCLWGKEIEKLTFYQRMSSIIYAILSLYNIFLTLSLFALPVVLLSGNALVAYANENQLRWLIRACFIALVINRLCELAMFLPSGYATGQRGARAQIWMAPYITVSIMRSFVLPTWLGGQKQAFKPTGSLKSELNERNPAMRKGIWRRFSVVAINYMAGYHLFYVYLVLAAVTLTTMRCVFNQPTVEAKLICLLTHAFWPPIAWLITISAFWTPIAYAINPPTVPDRERLLRRDPKTDIAHPTKESKKIAWRAQTFIFEFEYFISTAFTALVFVASFLWGIA